MSHESGQLYDGLFCRRGLVNTKVSCNSGWRHKWVIYIVTRPRGSEQTRPWAQPRLHSPLLPQRTHSPRLLYCSFLWQQSALRIGLLIVNSQRALMEIEKRRRRRRRKARASLHDVFMATGAPGDWFFFPGPFDSLLPLLILRITIHSLLYPISLRVSAPRVLQARWGAPAVEKQR